MRDIFTPKGPLISQTSKVEDEEEEKEVEFINHVIDGSMLLLLLL